MLNELTIAASGIYKITNTINGKFYIGSSVNLTHRKVQHFSGLVIKKHFNDYLQRAFNKYGSDAFIFEIIEYCSPEMCIEREQFYLDTFNSCNSAIGYNMCPKAHSPLGVKHTEQSRKNMSEAHKGFKPTRESIEKRRLKVIGQKRSPETCKRISEANKGRHNFPHVIEMLRTINIGRPLSQEHIEKLRAHGFGRKQTEETKRICSEKLMGRIFSQETIAKMRIAAKLRSPSGGKHPMARKVVDESTGAIYGCVKEAAHAIGMKRETLNSQLKGRNSNRTTLKYLYNVN